ncbi:immunoglobulin I-set domain protein [Dictyocaulus viviparus]|uniref:Immunoglobulin I-set domain protein n=1 Tax=Dictyocaulus viviparus TaxID=29172 RepID=A0A0D8XVW1_DICVI|nr:immunoglobulin I-set domain protein [Dictyocaulus viviparus]
MCTVERRIALLGLGEISTSSRCNHAMINEILGSATYSTLSCILEMIAMQEIAEFQESCASGLVNMKQSGRNRLRSTTATVPPCHVLPLYESQVDGELILPFVQLENTGQYTCLVSNLAGDDSITYNLEVYEKPQIVSETLGTIDVIMGLTLEIPCKARGTPEPEKIWKKDDIQIREDPRNAMNIDSAGTLRIMNVQTNHGGQYTCEVSNAAGVASQLTTVVVQEPPVILPTTITNYTAVEGDLTNHGGQYTCEVSNAAGVASQLTTVVVQEPPVILPTTITNYTAVEGDLVEIRCYVEASPSADILWLRRGVPITEYTSGILVSGGTLTIPEVTKDDATFYTCKVSNPAGKAEKVIRLSVIVPPDIPDQDVVSFESIRIHQSFSLYCPVVSSPSPMITWYLQDNVMTDDDPNVIFSEDKRSLHVVKKEIVMA